MSDPGTAGLTGSIIQRLRDRVCAGGWGRHHNACLIAVLALMLFAPLALAQSWTTMPIGFYPGTMVLMTDGTALVHYATEDPSGGLWPSDIWERLTPDAYGNYADGTWSTLPPMPAGYAPEFHATAVLPDGRLIVEGGEFIGESNQRVESSLGAIYDPVANTWTSVNPPPGIPGICGDCGYGAGQNGAAFIGDAQSVVLPSGQFMLGSCCGGDWFALLNASNLSWNSYYDRGKTALDPFNSEEGWVLLPSGQVLTVDLWNQNDEGTASMLYNPGNNSWSASGAIPVPLAYSACHEIGPMVLRPDGTVTAIGGNGQLATYNSSSGTWSAGPLIGGLLGVADGPAALLPDGNVFFQVAQTSPTYPDCVGNNSEFFEWDGTTLTQVPGPPDEPGDAPSYEGRMLVLPTGQVLYDDAYYVNNRDQDKNLFFYNPSGTYQAAWQPTVTSVSSTLIAGSTGNLLQGTQLNGLSQGAVYGDDEQMASNFPLVRITNNETSHVFYCRAHDFSTMAVATGSQIVSTQFDLPSNIEAGPSTLVVVANGIPSAPVSIDVNASRGTQSVTVSPTGLSFRSAGGSNVEQSASITNNGPGTLTFYGIQVNDQDGYFSLASSNCGSELGQGDSCVATVEFSPGNECISGSDSGDLTFFDSGTGGQQVVNLTGTTSGCVQTPVEKGATKPPALPSQPAKAAAKKTGGG